MAKFEINQAGMDKLERELREKFSAGIQIPKDGSEADAVQSVKDQLMGLGAAPNEAAVLQMVRDARKG
jgi:hypothetical protein